MEAKAVSVRRPRQLLHANESAVYEDCIRNQSTRGRHITFIDSIRWLYTGTKAHNILFQKRIGCIRGQYTGPAYKIYVVHLITKRFTIHRQGKQTWWTRERIICDPKIFWLHTLQHLTQQCYNNQRDAVHRNNRATHTNDVHTHGLSCLD